MAMDLRKLKTLIDLVSESGISELEVNEGEDRVRIVNARDAQAHQPQIISKPSANINLPQANPGSNTNNLDANSGNGQLQDETAALAPEGVIARSPMVGTFYRAPNPESPNFVQVGEYKQKC